MVEVGFSSYLSGDYKGGPVNDRNTRTHLVLETKNKKGRRFTPIITEG